MSKHLFARHREADPCIISNELPRPNDVDKISCHTACGRRRETTIWRPYPVGHASLAVPVFQEADETRFLFFAVSISDCVYSCSARD